MKTFPNWIVLCAVLLLGFAFAAKSFPSMRELKTSTGLMPILTIILILIPESFIFSGTASPPVLATEMSDYVPGISFLLVFAVKISLLLILTEVSRIPCFRTMIPANILLATAITFLTASFALAAFIIPSFTKCGYFRFSLALLTSIAVTAYLVIIVRILFCSKISLFYSFLYLCTLEFIPITIVTVMLTRL